MNVGVCCANIAAIIDEFKSRHSEESAADLDARIVEAYRADAKEQIAAMAASVAEGCKDCGVECHRLISIESCAGRISFRCPYTPGAGLAEIALGRLGCEKKEIRATPEARRIVAETSAQMDSFQEAGDFLKKNIGIDLSVSSIIMVTRKAAEKTRMAWLDDSLVANGKIIPRRKLPKGAKYVGPTMIIEVDGTCAPCTHADTEGIKGKETDEAGSREIKVVAIGIYTHVDKTGRPILQQGDVWYYASECSCNDLESFMNRLARRRGIGKVQRVQFIGDGAAWIQKIWEHAFKNCGAIRTLDFVHATSYLHKLLESLSCDGQLAEDYRRFKGILKKYGGTSLFKNLKKKFGSGLDEVKGDAATALSYLSERLWMMDYRSLRKNGYYIGSGIIESACKTIVGARCKLAGMHWRHTNAAGIALLRATLRSNFKIVA